MDGERIAEIIKFVQDKITELEDVLSKHKLSSIEFAAAERFTEEILGSVFKINDVLLEAKDEISGSYKEGFTLVAKLYCLDVELFSEISELAKFRNFLAHEYMDVDKNIRLTDMRKTPSLIKQYLKEIKKVL